jgi:hypothetical protein
MNCAKKKGKNHNKPFFHCGDTNNVLMKRLKEGSSRINHHHLQLIAQLHEHNALNEEMFQRKKRDNSS